MRDVIGPTGPYYGHGIGALPGVLLGVLLLLVLLAVAAAVVTLCVVATRYLLWKQRRIESGAWQRPGPPHHQTPVVAAPVATSEPPTVVETAPAAETAVADAPPTPPKPPRKPPKS